MDKVERAEEMTYSKIKTSLNSESAKFQFVLLVL